MKDFKFSLERMRSYKDQLLDREKDILARCRGREREAEEQIRALEEAESERQLQKVVAASQEVSSLDKLEERQREEYQLQAAKEGEKTISEFVSSRLIRERADGAEA